ncbi:prion-inhibition and propagation-domain-containing protein [Pseudomassariella vexata]|uniref:Prion-inhibition and propagation-domain-containing protein n=1 Tax=Pseudomassariella vexata TaxID=1141098 RepID=A0A1Y2E405_9PEZI|nr:prion-inhibition and propagation-domain-containing protein [Pseudomassariella vexata]ORY66249.1 prion-inhibition and propagation-domain-containing protein [Pseudomassariella vexata]
MAEALGTALAVVGVLGQLFDGCVKAYGHFTTATQFDADSQKVSCKIKIEETRLVVWGREWGVAEGKLEAHLSQAEKQGGGMVAGGMRTLALQILTELHRTITDVGRLRQRYGLVEGADHEQAVVGAKGGKGNDGRGLAKKEALAWKPGENGTGGNDRSWTHTLAVRAKWVVADKDKFDALLKDLKDYNDGLEQLFPASRLPGLQRAWVYELLQAAHRDVEQLNLLEHASNEVYPRLNASANLKQLRINLDNKPQALFKPTFAFRVPKSMLKVSGKNDPKRNKGYHEKSGTVLIEWVEYDKLNLDEKFVHMRRLDDLARMMHSATDRHPDLHTIDCLGYTDDAESSRYGLIYKAPKASYSTLHTLISSGELKTPDLNERIKLAQTLAVALWSLHSLDWLHKSLCSNNILFFPPAVSTSATHATAAAALVPDISAPYLVGFDASRPELDTEMSVASKNPSILDLHRHPKSLSGLSRRPYCKSYDIYSLGLVLLEIGLWKVLQTYYKPHYSAERWRDKVVLPVLVPGLGSKTGRFYRGVVERCLNVGDDISNEEADQVMESVVGILESINV